MPEVVFSYIIYLYIQVEETLINMNKIYLFKDAKKASTWVAEYFDKFIQENPEAVLGFATGTSPILTYKLLQEKCQAGTSWEGIKSFNLDEFIGVPVEHPESFRSQMTNNLFKGTNIKQENIFLPDGLVEDTKAEADRYEAQIEELGGIDLQYISLGANGHMAYNEPGTPLDSLTHVAEIAEFTRNVLVEQEKFATYEETPATAITVGVQTIMKFKQMLMIALGESKAVPAQKMLEGPVTSDIPSSALQNHSNTIFILDEAAAANLDLSKHEVTDMRGF